jgi:hypothetical protein
VDHYAIVLQSLSVMNHEHKDCLQYQDLVIIYNKGWIPTMIELVCQVVSDGEGEKFLCLYFGCIGSVF